MKPTSFMLAEFKPATAEVQVLHAALAKIELARSVVDKILSQDIPAEETELLIGIKTAIGSISALIREQLDR